MPSPATEVGSFPMGTINISGAASVSLFNPMAAQLDALLLGPFGIGSAQADLSAQFQAALSFQTQANLQFSDPIAGFQQALASIGQLVAGLQTAISLGLPTVSAELSASISASAAITAALGAKLGGISALIEAAMAAKIPAVNFFGDLQGSLSAGPIVLVAFGFNGTTPDPETLSNVGGQVQSLFTSGVTGITPSEGVSGIILLTKNPTASASISALFKVS